MRLVRALALLSTLAGLGQAAVAAPAAAPAAEAGRVRHSMKVTLDPARGWLSVTDDAEPSGGFLGSPAGSKSLGMTGEFLLHAGLKVTASEPAVTEVPLGDTARFFGINSSAVSVPLKRYRVAVPAAGGTVRLQYEGKFDFGLSDQKEEYTRGFRETAGIVSKEGVYLAGNGFWYPHVGPGLVEYDVEVTQPEGWHVVSAGNGTSRDAKGDGPLGVARGDRRDHPGGRAPRRLPRRGGRGGDPRLPAPEGRRPRLEVPAGDRAVRRDVPRARRPLPVRQVRARRELLGDGLRHAVLHAARVPGHPLPVHPELLLPARDPPQLVGQLGLRGLRERELVRGPDRLHGRPPHPGAAGAGRGVPARHPAEVPQLRARRARLPAHGVPLAPQRGDRGGGVREDADGLPHDPAADRGRGLPQVGGPLLPRVPREAGLVRRRAEVARGRGRAGPRPVLRRPRREARGGAAAGEAQRPARVDGRRLRGRLRDRADPAGGAAAARRAGRRADPREARDRHGPARGGPASRPR